ncbi:flagellar motor protein MotB [Actibacterium ureilyticum]|uniref:flagellar motor protein MotB n=1 Tax=Actibacterium ureilyticum TaxID=1590614 RepID=UPI000BAB182F|nr:flagellar motor protein MotB [Actibacterium ureilyticum]
MSAGQNAPVIIKRKKVVGGDGHHGGAWKVAYADFVTAMMAFFMLMWLLNATTEKQRKGIADYFNPTIPVNRISGGGDGSFGGESVFSEQVLAHTGTGASSLHSTPQRQAQGLSAPGSMQTDAAAAEQDAALAKLEEMMSARSGESMVSPRALRHILTRVTDEGLIVELFDLDGHPLFDPATGAPTPIMVELSRMIATVFALVQNPVAIGGHSRAFPLVLAQRPEWDRSTEQAHRTRGLIETAGLAPERIVRVTGFADRMLVARDPMAVRNNRIELTLLRRDVN